MQVLFWHLSGWGEEAATLLACSSWRSQTQHFLDILKRTIKNCVISKINLLTVDKNILSVLALTSTLAQKFDMAQINIAWSQTFKLPLYWISGKIDQNNKWTCVSLYFYAPHSKRDIQICPYLSEFFYFCEKVGHLCPMDIFWTD